MHPGWADTAGVRTWMPLFRALTRPVIRTPEQGADTIVWLGGAREAVETTGLFWPDLWVPKTCATWPDAPLTAGCSAPRRLPGRGMIFGLWG